MMTPTKAYQMGYRSSAPGIMCPFNDYASDLQEAWGEGFVHAVRDWFKRANQEASDIILGMIPPAGSC